MEFEAAGFTYRANKPAAREQFLLLRRVLPLLPVLRSIGLREAGAVGVLAAVEIVPEAELVECIECAFALCERRDGEAWVPADPAVLSLVDSLEIIAAIVSYNFGPYFAVKQPDLGQEARWRISKFQPVIMPDDLDWLYRPVLRGLCRAESLTDGTLHIEHFAEMNAVLDAADENQKRARQAAEAEANRR